MTRTTGVMAVLLAVTLGLTACGGAYDATPVPEASPEVGSVQTAPPTKSCDNATASYDPGKLKPQPAKFDDKRLSTIASRGRVIAGVSGDTFLFGSRNPATGRIEGFDIDLVKAVAKAILGDENAYELKVISAADRVTALDERRVDIVVRNMTMTCERWDQVLFSSEYYHAQQSVLAHTGSGIKGVKDLADRRVCAPNGTSSMDNLIREAPGAIPVPARNHTGCLVLFQSGKVDAITGDDAVLAGIAAQDPYAEVVADATFSDEPYGIATNREDVELVKIINARLAQMRSNGEWTAMYNRWLADTLGKAPNPPKAVYGR
ncbi:glutamate ABC transporter substrate-binding protein [Propionibacteriaceae bacterium Y1685]|uniref:glutamate ABC transporter substrate-binding protein n=1 Tax=Microlunatus sp. Y1700 TaxID=3418487 RepID=UPI003B81E342